MNSQNQAPINQMINDLELLIFEIENNPDLSQGVLRVALKSIKEKAKKSVRHGAYTTTIHLQQQTLLN